MVKTNKMTAQEQFLNDNMGFLNLIHVDFINIFTAGKTLKGLEGKIFINIGQNMSTTKFEDLYDSCHIMHDQFKNDKNVKIEEFDNKKENMFYTLIEKSF
jgi:hypothetical protein